MSVRVTVSELRESLPDILDRAVKKGEECFIERSGEPYAVIVSASRWRQYSIGKRLDALGPRYRLSKRKQARTEELLDESKQRKLKRAERQELTALLRESEDIMMRRAEAMARV
jgi:prevent-host-death family protein